MNKTLRYALLVLSLLVASLGCKRSPTPQEHMLAAAAAPASAQSSASVWLYGADYTGSQDSAPAFQKAVNALAGTGIALYVPSGQYLIKTSVVIPSNTTIVGSPGATIVGNLTSGGGSTRATFLAEWTANNVNSTLHAGNVPGSSTVSSNASYAAGQQIAIAQAAHTYQQAFYTVVSVSGSGPYTLTLDRPVLLQFSTNDTISGLGTSVPTNIHVLGNGMRMTGSPERHGEFAGCFKCSIEGVWADTSQGAPTGGDYWFSFDVGGRENTFRDMHVDGNGASSAALLALETNERSTIENSRVLNGSNYGILLLDDVECDLIGDHSWGNTYGVAITGEDTFIGSQYVRVTGGSYFGNSSDGVFIAGGSHDITINGVDASRNGSIGIYVNGGGTLGTPRTTVTGSTTDWNTSYGLEIASGGTGASIIGHRASNNGSFGLLLTDDTTVDGLAAYDTGVPAGAGQTSETPLAVNGSANVTARGLNLIDTQASTNFLIAVTGGTLELTDSTLRIGSGNYGLVSSGTSVVKVSRTKFMPVGSQSGEHGLIANASGTTIRLGEGVNASACATPIASGSGHLNRSTVTANGTSAVAFAFPDLTTTDSVVLAPTTGAPTAYLFSVTPGTGFSIKATAGDTQVYDVLIQFLVPLDASNDNGEDERFADDPRDARIVVGF